MTGLTRKALLAAAHLGLMVTAVVLSTPLLERSASATAAVGHDAFADRGNLWKSGNYRVRGRQVNSGNWDNANGSLNSDNIINGGNYANGPQHIVEAPGISKMVR
ncbi:hypothetical protein [Nonomuraea jiangxiensis]|uniref:Uncharacterized protein n=1 Tax=Nonomuraea jiangxiensis TaxID=633440 RepID=A0A1G8LSB1_9ACTN|nr:hypothetical protein [Nonomuraea jiangxiensis]SDI58513.1 hypothetical protein SAMN05421869_106188 [Nonomuraea jiangxiensis]